MRRLLLGAFVIATAALAVAGCSAHRPSAAPSTIYSTLTSTVSAPAPTVAPTGPLNTAAPVAADATACPLLVQATAADSVGMRLARIATLTQNGAVVGCQFFAVQGTALSASEHLPGPNQPAIEIDTASYASAVAARNAVVARATAGTNQQVVTLNGSVDADEFQTTFDPTDGASDWALVFNKAAKLVIVLTAIDDDPTDAVSVGNDIVATI